MKRIFETNTTPNYRSTVRPKPSLALELPKISECLQKLVKRMEDENCSLELILAVQNLRVHVNNL